MKIESLRRPIWAAGGLFLGAAVLLSVLFFLHGWGRVSAPAEGTGGVEHFNQAPAAATTQPPDDAALLSRLSPSAPVAAKAAPVVARDLPFDVFATFVETDPAQCQTILRDKSNHQYLVRNGQTAMGYKVVAIREGEVVLNGGGPDVTLKVASKVPEVAGPSPAETVPPQKAVVAPAVAAPGPVSDMFIVTHDQLQSYVASATQLMAQVELAPHHGPDTAVDGLQIVKMAPDSLAAQRGFREGDNVKVARRMRLTEPKQVPYFAALVLRESPPSVEVAIERSGAPMTLTYTLR